MIYQINKDMIVIYTMDKELKNYCETRMWSTSIPFWRFVKDVAEELLNDEKIRGKEKEFLESLLEVLRKVVE